MSDIKKLFVFVDSSKSAAFRTAHLNQTSDAYASKIAFLAGTGEIMTRGQVFAINKDADLTAITNLIGGDATDFASGVSATTLIGFINEVYGIATSNTSAIGDASSGLTKRVSDLETSVDTATTGLKDRMTAAEGAITTLNGDVNTNGSVAKQVNDAVTTAIANVVDGANASFDTLKEIADWILGDANNASAFDAANRIQGLETKVGEAAELYTAEDEAQDSSHVAGSVKTPSTGIYASIDDLQGQINSMSGGAGSIATQIENKVSSLDGSVTLAGTTATQPSTVTRGTAIDVLGSVTITETDGKIVNDTTGKVVLQADAAGAAAQAYADLLGTSSDVTTDMTLYGIKAYAADLVSNKNVTASGDNSLISASASNNAVSVAATQDLIDAVSHANTAIQSVTLSSGNVTYLTVTNVTGSGDATAASAQYSPVIGVAPTITGLAATKGTNGLATTDQLADTINALDFWENYSE